MRVEKFVMPGCRMDCTLMRVERAIIMFTSLQKKMRPILADISSLGNIIGENFAMVS